MLSRLLGDGGIRRTARALYASAVEQARRPDFFARCGVPDTIDGRFDMISVHVFLLLRRLKAAGGNSRALSQALFDALFEDMDRGLREMGAGDLGVGRRVKTMAQAFAGRVAAYEAGLNAEDDSLPAALARNVFRSEHAPEGAVTALALYMRRQAEALAAQPIEQLAAGSVAFVDAAAALGPE